MKPFQCIHSAGALLLCAAFLLPGCSSEDTSTPANTLVLTDANASSTIAGSSALTQLLITLAEGAANFGSGPCNISGTVTVNDNTTVNGTTETTTGTITANNCEDSAGVIINGAISYTFTFNLSTGADSVSVNGGVTINDNGDTVTVSGLRFAETSDGAGNYSTNTISFTLSSSLGETFTVMLTAPIVGVDGALCPTTGGVQVNGGSGTQARAVLINGGSQVMIELNTGTGFAEVAGSPVSCNSIFF